VAPSEHFARKALAEFPGPVWPFAPQYSEMREVATRAFPESTEFYLELGMDTVTFTHAWPERRLVIIVHARLLESGTVEIVDYETVTLPDSPS
jgi:hypothetical protein